MSVNNFSSKFRIFGTGEGGTRPAGFEPDLEWMSLMGLREPRIIGFVPGAPGSARQLLAVVRAGALGVLDLAWTTDVHAGLLAAGRLDRKFGVRLAASSIDEAWLKPVPDLMDWVIAVEEVDVDWASTLRAVRRSGRRAWAEVTSRVSAEEAVVAGAEGLILAGHEAGGLVSEDSSFILLQAVLDLVTVPVWVRGGIGPRVACGCLAAGAAGVVLDGALLLASESPRSTLARDRIRRWDGGETSVFGLQSGAMVRVAPVSDAPSMLALRDADSASSGDRREVLRAQVGWGDDQYWPVGQDSALAELLAGRYITTGGIIQAFDRAFSRISTTRPLAEGSAMARSLGTRFPILQGPMTRVSDVVEFADAVAGGGGLPFLALALMRGPDVSRLLDRAARDLAGRPWGVGILGFAPANLRDEQMEAILRARPPFALIAGGRPDQAEVLDRNGILTFLHVPSPGLLARFLKDGARRFVLEGRECGGHVGPRSSFLLWEQSIGVLVEAIDGGTVVAEELHVAFAGGIHDARSSAMVSAMAAPLSDRGVKVGVLVGTAYLFTEEAVATGAIVGRFQEEAIRCRRTVLLRTGPGHEVRVGPSPFVDFFESERLRLVREKVPLDEARDALERLNAGRLRVASKGLERGEEPGSPLLAVDERDQFDRGIYMLGQVATLRDRVTTIDELHRSIADGLPAAQVARTGVPAASKPSDVAIVGMSAIMPGAGDVRTFWENTLRGVDSITEIPPDRWDWRTYYDADPKAPDKIISKWGGFVPDVPFDPLRYGMPPASLPSIEPVQLLLLEATRAAIDDAGYAHRPFDRERTAVVLGMGGGAAQLAMGYAFRSYLPMLDAVRPGAGTGALEACQGLLPEWTEDSFPGFLLNVAAGRLANRFDLGGANYTVDAACGSSLAAASLAVRELESGSADVVLLGGADTVQNPFTYLAFSKTQAFSPRGRCRPFDASADGIVISEGVAMVVLKRLADAERDGDRIYAVIKGIGASSDGRAKGLTAPAAEGQVRAVERAYAKAEVDPRTVGYVEAHGTGTAVGDVVEVNSIARVFREAGVASGSVAIGSVKSMIGHTKCAAGLAGLINASLALYHKVLPPTIGVQSVNPKADLLDGPFRVNTRARPWIHSGTEDARRAGVSAFGFGGTNFHAVLEAYEGDVSPQTAPSREWPTELFAWRATDRTQLIASLNALVVALEGGARPALRDLARAVTLANPPSSRPGPTLAIVASSIGDLRDKLRLALNAICDGQARIENPLGLYYDETPRFHGEPVAFLFPGQGSQSPGMLAELAMTFGEIRGAFDDFDAALSLDSRPRIGTSTYPDPGLDPELARDALRSTDLAQPAIGAASVGLLRLLQALGVEPDVVGGHSFGELVALHSAGSLSAGSLAILAHERGRLMLEALGESPGVMAAFSADRDEIARLIEGLEGVVAVNENGPGQTVIAGPGSGVGEAVVRAKNRGIRAVALSVGGAFHTPGIAKASAPLAIAARSRIDRSPDRPVFSNLDARPHPREITSIADRLGEHLASPVRFAPMVEAMHEGGARVFVEVGPGSVLSPLVGAILGEMPHLIVSCDSPSKPGLSTLLMALGRLLTAGVPARLDRLTMGRSDRVLDLAGLPKGDGSPPRPATTWLVNGSRARPIDRPEPRRLGQAGLIATPKPPAARSSRDPASPPPRNGTTNGHHSNGHPTQGKQAMIPPASPNPRPPAVPAQGSADERILASFQETMRSFLDVQRSTMLAYLASRPSGSTPPSMSVPIVDLTRPRIVPEVFERAAPTPPPKPQAISTPAPIPSIIPAVAVEEAVEATANQDSVAAKLVEIVRDRTGYPSEMLGLDLDLEADLGIDSIKRVEILGTLRDALPSMIDSSDSSTMDALSRAKTLGAIVAKVVEIGRKRPGIRSPQSPAELKSSPPAPAIETQRDPVQEPLTPRLGTLASPIRRMVLEVVDAPLSTDRSGLPAGGVVLVTDDGRGVARAVASELEEIGHSVILAGPDEVDFSSPSSVEGLLDLARSSGEVVAIVHALPLRHVGSAGLDRRIWADRINGEVKGLFLLAKVAAYDLDRASRRGGAALVAATSMGGRFGSGPGSGDFFPGHGGVAGLVKTLAREWEQVRARVVDFDLGQPVAAIAGRLVDEVRADDGWSEVGYVGDRRIRLRGVSSRLDVSADSRLDLEPGEPVIVTGGARGITATLAAELASRWRPTLLLLGRNPPPPEVEDLRTRGITSATELKASLMEELRGEGRPLSAAELERAYQSVRQAREIRRNLETYRASGATVEYAGVDVRDARALSKVLNGWRGKHGEPVGLIHGAGVIKDKLIRDKTPDVVRPRPRHQARRRPEPGQACCGPTSIRFAALFSSIAGRYRQRRAGRLRGGQRGAQQAGRSGSTGGGRAGSSRSSGGRGRAWGWSRSWKGHLGARGLEDDPARGRAGRSCIDELRFWPQGRGRGDRRRATWAPWPDPIKHPTGCAGVAPDEPGRGALDIAIVGMACRFPGAPDLFSRTGKNILGRRRRDHRRPAPTVGIPGHLLRSRIRPPTTASPADGGGYLSEAPIPFDPAAHGIMPHAVDGGEPEQFLVLDAARAALADAGLEAMASPTAGGSR